MTDAQIDRSRAAEFEDTDVVACYVHRPPYPNALHARLLDLMPTRGRVLDLGCGPGKLARALATHVDRVIAVDPSAAMLDLARTLDANGTEKGANPNIAWTHARAEDLDLEGPIHLAVAGAAIHWMDPAVLFPKLAAALAPGAPVAIIDGDGPAEAAWHDAYMAVIKAWVARTTGRAWNDAGHAALMSAHDPWFDVQGRETFSAVVRQSVEDLIACEHSRATWARSRMGASARTFDADLTAALAPWAVDGAVEYEVRTRLAWGWARDRPG